MQKHTKVVFMSIYKTLSIQKIPPPPTFITKATVVVVHFVAWNCQNLTLGKSYLLIPFDHKKD